MPSALVLPADSLEARIAAAAFELGFVRLGFSAADRSEPAAERLRSWLSEGLEGEMHYMRGELDRCSPAALFEPVQTVLAVALPYGGGGPLLPRRSRDGAPLTG
ncbi:MAG TPA: hypothetical protein VIW29_03000, partial [Polyangiaceae bacterium]